jgi:drug/metabolite transporter (DMT)-like permease
MPLAMGGAGAILGRMRDPAVRYRMIGGTVAGPLVGMAFYVAALGLAPAGVVATLTSTSPLFILPMVVWRYGARITPDVVAATLVAVGGVAMIFW